MLSAWNANSSIKFQFDDLTPGAIDTDDVGRVKAVLTTKLQQATHTLVLVGSHANDFHPDRASIGQRNWIWWEIEQSKKLGNKLIAVKIQPSNTFPEPLFGSGATQAKSFTFDAIVNAINAA